MSSILEGMLAQCQAKNVKLRRLLGYWFLSLFITATIWLGLAWTIAKIFEETIVWGAVWVVFFYVASSAALKSAVRQVSR